MKVSVVVFPGSNCDHDLIQTYEVLLKQEVNVIWHRESDLKGADLVLIPGGFSYGDYLRTGALAKISPIMRSVSAFAAKGGPVIGICNGFQILCEAGLLPGVLLVNASRKFLSRPVHVRVEATDTPLSRNLKRGEVLASPIAHFEGNYFAAEDEIARLEDDERVVFRYCDPKGQVNAADPISNPNGSINAIAGICNEKRNVIGLMPHPERAAEAMVGGAAGADGFKLLQASVA